MSRNCNEVFNRTMNRIKRLKDKENEIIKKKTETEERFKKSLISWIKKNRPEWFKNIGNDKDPWLHVVFGNTKNDPIIVKVMEFYDVEEEDGFTGQASRWVVHELHPNELN